MSKDVKRCHLSNWSAMSLLIVIFGPAPNLEVFGQHFGMEGPMQLSPVCHIAIPLEIAKLGVA